MKCWICKRQARGYGCTDGRYRITDSRHYVRDWVFCSLRCQKTFQLLYGNWMRAREGEIDKAEVVMIDPSDVELAAMRQCLKAFGEAASEIGFARPLAEYSEAQALQVIDAIVSCWSNAMVAHHESSAFPPVQGMPTTADPMAAEVANPFADFRDDLPWLEGKGEKP